MKRIKRVSVLVEEVIGGTKASSKKSLQRFLQTGLNHTALYHAGL